MNIDAHTLDWAYIRSFLAVAETGSLTAAAQRTGQSQPTLSRHVKIAEDTLRTSLFTRARHGLTLTEAGRALLGPARAMARASAQFSAVATGQDTKLSGTVRITASVVVSHYLLPRILADLRRAEPDIEIELVPSDSSENLLYREADIALRMYRPTQLDIVTRKIADQSLALYAARDLVDRLGQPETLEDLRAFPFVGFDRSDMIIRAMREIGLNADRHFFGIRCDNQATFWELVRAGAGVGAMQAAIGDGDPAVIRLRFQPGLPSLPIWLATSDTLFKSPMIRRVWDHLAQHLGKHLGKK